MTKPQKNYYVRQLRTYLIRVKKEETAKRLDETAIENHFAQMDDTWEGFKEFMICSRMSPFELMDISDIYKIVALTPYRS